MRLLLPFLCLGLAGLASAAELQVRVTPVDASGGQLLLALFDSDASWREHRTPLAQVRLPAQQGVQDHLFTDLPPGRYALAVIHDSNANGELDTNVIGMPKEQYGYSNNPPLRMRMATFAECAFELPAAGTALTVDLR